jgi:Tol biopolymer transport system component
LALAIVLVQPTHSWAAPGNISVASTSSTGVKGSHHSSDPSLSADGTKVAFVTFANLDPADTNFDPDVYVKDLTTGQLTLATAKPTGEAGGGGIPDLSADGQRVAMFCGFGVAGDGSVCVRDLVTGEVKDVAPTTAGAEGPHPTLSADGSIVAFESPANLDGSTVCKPEDEIWVARMFPVQAPPQRVTCTPLDDFHPHEGYDPVISGDGTRVAFMSERSFVPADTDDCDWFAHPGCRSDIYVADLTTGEFILASASDDTTKANGPSSFPDLSSDGRKVAFISFATNLDPRDTNDRFDLYVKDLVTGDITLAATDVSGTHLETEAARPSLSFDGTKVAFHVQCCLDPADTDTPGDVYVKDLVTGDVTLASTSDLGVKGCEASGFPSLSADGSVVTFMSAATNLDPVDTDPFYDVYVKEVGGNSSFDCGGGTGTKATRTTYTGAGSVQYSDPASLSGTLEDISGTPVPISGRTLQFAVGSQTASAGPTDATGSASTQLVVTQQPGTVATVGSSFAGDSTYKPSSDSDPFSVLKEDCTLTYSGDTLVQPLTNTRLAADLGEFDASLGDRSAKPITFTLTGSAGNVQTFTAATDGSGHAEASIPLAADAYSASASFAGDDFYHSCSTPALQIIVTVQDAGAKVTGGGWIRSQSRTNFGFNLIPQSGGTFKTQFQLRAHKDLGKFHASIVTSVRQLAPNSVSWSGTGTWLTRSGCSYQVTVVDRGSSGSKKGDTIGITIICGSTNVYATGAVQQLSGGNITVH